MVSDHVLDAQVVAEAKEQIGLVSTVPDHGGEFDVRARSTVPTTPSPDIDDDNDDAQWASSPVSERLSPSLKGQRRC